MKHWHLYFLLFSITILTNSVKGRSNYTPLQIDSIERFVENSPKDSMGMSNYFLLANHYFNKNLTKSKLFASRSYQLAKEIKSIEGQAKSLFHLSKVERRSGQLKQAINHINQAARYYNKIDDQKALGEIKAELGNLYADMGNLVKSIESYQEAIEVFEEVNYQIGIAQSYSDLGNTHFFQKNYHTALRYFKKSKTIFEKEKDLKSVAELYNRISNVYRAMEELEKSLDYNYYALMIQEKMRDKAGIATSNMNIAKTNIDKGELKRAGGYIDYAVKLYREIGEQLGLTKALLISAEIEIELGNNKLAKRELETCIKIATDAGALKELSKAYLLISSVYDQTGKVEDAFRFLKQHNNLRDTLYSYEQTKLFSEMEVKYQTKTKDRELIKQKNISKQKSGQLLIYIFLSLVIALALILIILLLYKKNKLRKDNNSDLAKKNDLIFQKNQEIIDSIQYAKKIQDAIVTPKSYFKQIFKEFVLIFKPKDIVSGDFYWAYEDPVSNKTFWVTADCTGHGVPGALMSVIGTIMLNEIIIVGKNHEPEKVLKKLSKYLKRYINSDEEISRDGIELSFCILDKDNNKLTFCGANGKGFVHKKDGEIIDLKGSKHPIGYDPLERNLSNFEVITLPIDEGDWVVTYTDGFPDQLGEKNRKKYKVGKLKNNFAKWNKLSSQKIQENLNQSIQDWQGNLEQIDDMLIIAIKL